MKERLELSIDSEIKKAAKKKAEEECWSLSAKVEKFLKSLLKNDKPR